MKKLLLLLITAWAAPALAANLPAKPRLVVAVVVDQLRYDYLTRFRGDFKGGFARLLGRGASFTDAHFEHFPTVTAIGHSVILTGAMPSVSGIIGNDWYDRGTAKQVTSVSDPAVRLVGGSGDAGSSPRRLLVSTLGDEMKAASQGKSRVIGMSLKDRAAILPAGHAADAAFWFDSKTGGFVSSTHYLQELPGWVKEFNAKATDPYRGAEWMGRKLPSDNTLFSALAGSPFGNEILVAFAERALQEEGLGKDDIPDLLAVSFSSNDYVGHEHGPDSPEVRDITLQTDRQLDRLFRALEAAVGMQNVLVVLTADHGVAPLPEAAVVRRMPGGRMPAGIVGNTVRDALSRRFGEGSWIVSRGEHSLYINHKLVEEKRLDLSEVVRVARDAVTGIPHVLRVYTREQLREGRVGNDRVDRMVGNGFHYQRAADIYVLLEPYWMFGSSGTTHGSVFNYDSHVPLIFMGPGIRASRYHERVAVNDIAPTLAAILEVEVPSGSSGRTLGQILEQPRVPAATSPHPSGAAKF